MATYKNLTDFLIKHQASIFKDKVVTHTRIGNKDKTKKIYGGSYVIEPDELDTFRELYYDHVFVKNNKEYLTEVQFKNGSTIAVDLDFRYDVNITERQHTPEDIQNIVCMYLDCLKDAFEFNGNSKFDIFVFEKPNVNIVNEKNITKDGIHMLINIKTDHIAQQLIREKVMKDINNDVLNLPLTNSWEEVFDEGISKGTTNWQVFGSRKPDNEAYELSHHYSIEVDETDGEFMMEEKNINDFNLKDNLKLLSVQNDNLPEFPLTQLFKKKYDEKNKEYQTPNIKQKKKRLVLDEGETDTESVGSINEDKAFKKGKCIVRLMILRSCFEKGQYNNWYKIGCILRSIFPYELGLKLFTDFSYVEPFNTEKEKENTISVFEKINPNSKYTMKSLDLMCQQINPAEYEKDCATVVNGGDNEAAILIYKELKDVFVYSAGKFWYKLNNKWYNDEKEVKMIVKNYILNRGLVTASENEKTGKISYRLYSSCNNHAKNILDVLCGKSVENKDDKFSEKFIETTKNKICFNNGVLNLQTKEFKSWEQSQDVYTTIIIDYDYNPNRNETAINDVLNKIFINIFGEMDYKRALHFFSRAITGNIQDKSWGMFIGSRNCGKGVNECLFKNTFMDYIGSISSDLFIYKGKNSGDDLKLWGWIQDIENKRLCFIQESKLDDGDNHLKLDGVMIKKVSSGGDPIQNRKNFQDPINSYIQTTFMFNANDTPPFTKGSGDCMETCSTFSSAKQFKSKEFIDERIANGACETEMSLYYERDDFIKDKCKSMEWKQALIHIIIDNFNKTAVKSVNKFKEEDDCDDIISVILKSFKITKNKEDKITNKDLKFWASNNSVHLSKKLKPILKQFGCEEYKSGGKRGIQGLILTDFADGVEEE